MAAPALRWGIIGPGAIARKFANNVSAFTASRVLAVGSRSAERAEAFAAELSIERAYGSYAELVADPDVDAVYVASPHSEHRDHAIEALEAGKPVLVEKAFTRSAAEAREVFDVAGKRGLFAMEAMWSRFLPHYAAVREVVRSGELGEIVSFTAQHGQYLVGGNPRLWKPELAGGAVLDLGVYPLSLAHYLFGAPTSVQAHGSLTPDGVDLGETIVLRYGERLVAVAEAYLDVATENAATIAGVDGRVEIHRTFYSPTDVTVVPREGESRTIGGAVPGGFQFEAAEAARCIAAGRTESEVLPWSATVEVLGMADEVRRQLGVVYPGE